MNTEVANTIAEMVSTIGFPIVIVFVILYFGWKLMESWNETIKQLAETVENNTDALEKMSETQKEILRLLKDGD